MSPESTCSVRIDGRNVEAPAGASLLAGALAAGVYIPHLCSNHMPGRGLSIL